MGIPGARPAWRLARLTLPFAVASCQLVIGTEDRELDPVTGGCVLPTSGGAKVRFANLVAADGAVDVCVRSTGGAYSRAVLRGGGTACPTGFVYPQVSAPFAVPEGRIDIKVVRAGSACSASPLAQLSSVEVPRGSITSVVHLGNAREPPVLRTLRDATDRPSGSSIHLRFAHASAGLGPLDFGFAAAARLPVDKTASLLTLPISFGEATNAQTSAVVGRFDGHGYLELPGTEVNIVATRAGEKRALLATNLPPAEGWRTLYVIGDSTATFQPLRGLLCEELVFDGIYTSCKQSALSTLAVDSYNVALYGPAAQEEEARRPRIVEAIAARESDLMCLSQATRKLDRDKIVAAARASGAFRFSFVSETDLDTVATDPRDQDGKTPVPRPHPSCGGTNDPKQVEAALSCITNNCSTTGGPDGSLVAASCVSSKCISEMIALLAGDADARRCFNCIAVSSGSAETFNDVRAQCSVDKRDYKGFRGQTASLILSRFPIRSSETYVLPSTSYQRVVQYAEVEIEAGKFLDYYCTNLTSPYGDLLAYSGFYSGGATSGEAWRREAQLQAMRAVEFIKRKSGVRAAIVSGDWSASRQARAGDGTVLVDELNPKVLDIVEAALAQAVPDKWVAMCTECKTPVNPYNTEQNTWASRNFVLNMPGTPTVEASVFFKEPVVTLSAGAKGPLSHSFGFSTRILRPN